MRLGLDEVGVTELMGVTEHARAMSTTAAALLLDWSAGGPLLVAPIDPAAADPAARERLVGIAARGEAALGSPDVPLIWGILARNPHYLEATWRKETAVMADGALTAHDKRRTALGVSRSVDAT